MDDKKENTEEPEASPNPSRRPGRLVRLDRVFIGSLTIHALVLGWLLLRLFSGEEPIVEETPMRWASEVSETDDSPQPYVPEQVDPPLPSENLPSPEAQVIADPIEPAPWLRPSKIEHRHSLVRREETASTRQPGLSASYRAPSKTEKEAPTEIADSPPTRTEIKPGKKKAPVFVAARKKKGACKRPPYPRRALRRRLTGKVTFLVDVSLKGEVLNLQLEKSSGHDILDRAAKSAIADWQFIPATRDSQPVRDRVRAFITFVIPK
ncbi:MAG: protein TonB [Planctomycetota bacterium]